MIAFIKELRRRKVFRIAGAYFVVGWLLAQMAGVLEASLNLPGWFDTLIVSSALLGFPVALVLAWAYEATPDGVRPTSLPEDAPTPKRSLAADGAILLALGLVAFLMITDPFSSRPPAEPRAAEAPEAASLTAAPRIAVEPIAVRGGDGETAAMAADLRDGLSSALARFHLLQVAADTDETARYRLAGALRQSGDDLRLSMRLIDQRSGQQVWGETYDRTIAETSLLRLQDDFTDHVAAAVGDAYGAVIRDLQTAVLEKAPQAMTPFEALVRHSIYIERVSPADHEAARIALERAAETEPGNALVWAALASLSIDEVKHGFGTSEDAADRALSQAQRAVALDPDSAYAYYRLAEVRFFRRELDAFEAARDRALALNPRDSDAAAFLGILTSYGGDWERGVALTERAMELNPRHPGWYRFASALNAYRLGEHEAALREANAVNMPGYFADPWVRAVILAKLGREEEAAAAVEEFREVWPADIPTFRKLGLENWFYSQPELRDAFIADLRSAGLEIG